MMWDAGSIQRVGARVSAGCVGLDGQDRMVVIPQVRNTDNWIGAKNASSEKR
jgi:hypothetical protein